MMGMAVIALGAVVSAMTSSAKRAWAHFRFRSCGDENCDLCYHKIPEGIPEAWLHDEETDSSD